ncbi:MAG: FxsA family protein [Nitrospira sp.]|nr:FxsA family protein [Candidatus Manganitrophaceae bacterium]HIL35617.1 FxsA family protein [Candidatus Manganitrophaceae bacterium]
MFAILLILFIVVPFIEITILIKLGSLIGFWPTIGIQIGTGIMGASLAKLQGLFVWRKITEELQLGRIPTQDMVNGVLIFAAGLVLMTPGLLTDLLGFGLLIPTTRNAFRQWLERKFKRRITIDENDFIPPL